MFYELFMQSVVPFNTESVLGYPLYRPAAISAELSGKYNENNLTERFRLKYAYNGCGAGRRCSLNWPLLVLRC